MKLKTLTREDILQLADSPEIFHRGTEYAEEGLIYQFSATPNSISAKLHGNYGNYTVTIREAGTELKTECTCPYDGVVCKHIVGALLYYLDHKDDVAELSLPGVPSALQQTLEGYSRDALLKLMLKLAEENANFQKVLLDNISLPASALVSQPKNPALVKRLKKQIDRLLAGVYSYIESGYEGDIEITELNTVFQEAQALHPIDQIEIFWHAISEMEDLIEEVGLSTTQIETALKYYGEAIAKLQLFHKEKKPFFDQLCEALDQTLGSYGETVNGIKTALDIICSEPNDYKYLIKKFEKLDSNEASDWIAGYYLTLGDEKSYLKTRTENLREEYQFLELADFWKAKGNEKQYVETLESWLKHLGNRPQAVSPTPWLFSYALSKPDGVLKRLADHYEEQGDTVNLVRIFLALARWSHTSLELYQLLKREASKLGTWSEARTKFFEFAKSDLETQARIHLEEQNWSEALRVAQSAQHHESLKVLVADGIKHHLPNEAVALYEKLVTDYIGRQKRESYKSAATYAEKMKDIYLTVLKDQTTWKTWIAKLREEHKRRPALQDEFRKL